MQENTKSETPEDFSENEEPLSNEEETSPQENSNSPDSGFEEQEGELLPPHETRKSGTGKVFLLLILFLAGLVGYLYFNNLIPAKVLNLIFPKSSPSRPPALITQTPSFVEVMPEITGAPKPDKVVEAPEPEKVVEATIPDATNLLSKPYQSQEIHISGHASSRTESANDFGQKTIIERETHLSGYKPIPTLSGDGFSQKTTMEGEVHETPLPNPDNPIEEKEFIVEQKSIETPVTESISVLRSEPAKPLRNKAVQAYLDFIESTLQKLFELAKECFEISWNYVKGKLSS